MEILARAVGRRKEAVAQVKIVKETNGVPGGQFIINNLPAEHYLHNNTCSLLSIKAPLSIYGGANSIGEESITNNETLTNDSFQTPLNTLNNFNTIVKVKGGGLVGQAEAIKLGLARAICQLSSLPSGNQQFVAKVTSTNNEGNTKLVDSKPQLHTGEEIRREFKDKGYLTQDSRIKERRKYGLKKARKASQYHKR